MTEEFCRAMYQQIASSDRESHKRCMCLYNCNPKKMFIMEYLIRKHEERGDKTIVFCDNIPLLKYLSDKLKIAHICGDVKMSERMACINLFR